MDFINDRFMINNEVGVRLYKDVASKLPIIDYHCHLDAKEIYENKQIKDITQLWLSGDHYKWRAMRANGIDEHYITGNATAEEKFKAWAETIESAFGNPLYHWTHLELSQYFSCNMQLDSTNWQEVMEHCNQLLKTEAFKPRNLITRSNVDVICTTDAPLDSLEYHRLLQREASFPTKVLPTFRPDDVFVESSDIFSAFIDNLAGLTHNDIASFADFDRAIEQRVKWFHDTGCRISDHGPVDITFRDYTAECIETIFAKKRRGQPLTTQENAQLNSAIFVCLASHYQRYGWAMQIHFGAIRNNNSTMHKRLGINTGFDSISDQCRLASGLNKLLDAINKNSGLPKTIIYNLNPGYNDVVATAIANFQSADQGVKSPIQFGSGWWFNDTRRGMENHLNCLAEQGLLMNFVGMLTDSRSLVSYPRHDYFRRILCNLIGGWVERGEVPDNNKILTKMIRNICHDNACNYFKF